MTLVSPSDGLRSRGAFMAPSPAAGVTFRREVMDLLTSGGVRVAVVVAPGGYGKTSHVAAWVKDDTRPVAWVDVDDSDVDPHRLLAALVGALGAVTNFDAEGLPSGGATPGQFTTMVAPHFGRAVRRCNSPFALVLDDVHVLTTQSAMDLLDALVCNVPDGSTVAVVGRAAPLASLRRIRTEAGVVEVGTEELALDSEEVHRVLAEMGVPRAAIDAAQVMAATEGWPVGVRLAGAQWLKKFRRDRNPSHRLDSYAPHVAEYLIEEWLGELRPEHRQFMLQVSCVDWLSGPLCNAIVDRNDAGDVLHRIFDERRLLIPLDRRAETFRMHPLLRDALRAEFERVDAVGARAASTRASEWFEAVGDIDRAVAQAQAARDMRRVERLIVEHAPACYTNGRYATLSRWLDALPRERVVGSSSLCLCAAMSSLGLGDSEATRAWLHLSEQVGATESGGDEMARLRLLVWRAVVNTGAEGQAYEGALQAYRDLPPGIWHAAACLALGASSLATDGEHTESLLSEGAEEAAIWGGSSVEAGCRALLALMAYRRGDSPRARTFARAARSIAVDKGLEQSPSLALVVAVSALMAAVGGELDRAREDFELSRRHLAYLHDVSGWTNVQTRLALTRTSLLLGDRVGAEALLKEVREYLATQPDAIGELRRADELEEMVRSKRRSALRGPSSLSTAELRVLHFMPTNLTVGDIADRLYLSRFTVKTHCSAIYRKLAVTSRAEAVETAQREGLLPSSSVATNRR